MHAVRQGNDLGLAVAGKFQRFQRPHGIPRKTDSDNNILLADPDNLLKYLAGSIGIDYRHVPADQIQVKTQEISQRGAASDADHIDPSGIENGIHRKFKHFMINGCHGHLDLLNIRLQDGCKNFSLADPAIGNFHALDGIQLRADQFTQSLLKARIPIISEGSGKTDYGRFADAYFLSHPGRRQKSSLVVVFPNKVCQFFLALAELRIAFIYFLQQLILASHIAYSSSQINIVSIIYPNSGIFK